LVRSDREGVETHSSKFKSRAKARRERGTFSACFLPRAGV